MSSVAQSFSQLSASLTKRSKELGVGGGRANMGVLGPTLGRTVMRQQLDKTLGVAPIEGDPGYVAPPSLNVTPVTPMPVPGVDDLSNVAARRRSIEDQLRRRGRMSTVLGGAQTEPLGG
jgi:hypothetical protein